MGGINLRESDKKLVKLYSLKYHFVINYK